MKDALQDAPPLPFLALRFCVGGLAMAALSRGRLPERRTLAAGALLGALLSAGFVLQSWGLVYTTPSRSAFITGLCVVLVPFVSILVVKRWPTPPSLLGVLLAVTGLFELTGVGLVHAEPALMARGDLLTVLCAGAFALHIAFTERLSAQHDPKGLVLVQLWIVALVSGLGTAGLRPQTHLTSTVWIAVVYCGLFATAGAIYAQTWAQARTSAVRAALIFSLEPVFAAAYSVSLGRERLGPRELAGGALIVLGVITAEVGAAAWRRRNPLGSQVGPGRRGG